MKDNYSFIPSRDLKQFCKRIKDQYGTVPELFDELAFVQGKDKIYIIERDAGKIDLKNIRINSIGLYIAEVKGGQLRLSIEGAQIIGPTATKNVCEISEEQLKQWFKGQDLKAEGAYSGFVILKCGNDYVGSGKYREGLILNFVPKSRRLQEVH